MGSHLSQDGVHKSLHETIHHYSPGSNNIKTSSMPVEVDERKRTSDRRARNELVEMNRNRQTKEKKGAGTQSSTNEQGMGNGAARKKSTMIYRSEIFFTVQLNVVVIDR